MSNVPYTVAEAAQRLRLHPKTVLRYIREGGLTATRVGKSYRIAPKDLLRFAGEADAGDATGRAAARVTCVVDVPDASPALHQYLTRTLHGALGSRAASAVAVHLETIYDPELAALKVVILAGTSDTASLLEILENALRNADR